MTAISVNIDHTLNVPGIGDGLTEGKVAADEVEVG